MIPRECSYYLEALVHTEVSSLRVKFALKWPGLVNSWWWRLVPLSHAQSRRKRLSDLMVRIEPRTLLREHRKIRKSDENWELFPYSFHLLYEDQNFIHNKVQKFNIASISSFLTAWSPVYDERAFRWELKGDSYPSNVHKSNNGSQESDNNWNLPLFRLNQSSSYSLIQNFLPQ